MIEKCHWHRITEGTLFIIGISISWNASQLEQRRKISEPRVTGHPEYRRIEVVARSVDPVEKRGELHLPDMNREPGSRKLRLHQLL